MANTFKLKTFNGSSTAANTEDFNTGGVKLINHINTRGGTIAVNRRDYDGDIVRFHRQSSVVGAVSVTSSGATYNTTSDCRLKTDIQPITNGTEKLMAMNPITHKRKADPAGSEASSILHAVSLS